MTGHLLRRRLAFDLISRIFSFLNELLVVGFISKSWKMDEQKKNQRSCCFCCCWLPHQQLNHHAFHWARIYWFAGHHHHIKIHRASSSSAGLETSPGHVQPRPMGGQPAAPTTGLRCFLQTLVSWSLNLSLWRNLNLIILTPEDRGRGCIISSGLTPKEDYVCQIKRNLGFDLLHMFRSFPSNCIHNGSHHIPSV